MHPTGSPAPSRFHRLRLLAPFGAGTLLLLLMCGGAAYYYTHAAGIGGFIGTAGTITVVRNFALRYFLTTIWPVYLVGSAVAWALTLLWGMRFEGAWKAHWKGRDAFGFTLSALLWIQTCYWWQTPSTLWVVPGLRSLPLWAAFALLLLGSWTFPLFWVSGLPVTRGRKALCVGGWAVAWTALALLPQAAPRPRPAGHAGESPCEQVWIGLDGLRSDLFLEETHAWQGQPYENAYTPIPATRLLWNMLWGGDPGYFSVGSIAPSTTEFENPQALPVLRKAGDLGWKPRFYIDDGGTIGLSGRDMGMDDVLMPAAGWENFVNSNLGASFPLYANWENWFKPFPTTNPWSRFEDGLNEALRLGRGSKWVMFHSCQAHQPIFLRRHELAAIPRWWVKRALDLEPFANRYQPTQDDVEHGDRRVNPYLAYKIRMQSILRAWEPIWNGLKSDPTYGKATRVLFSDHGERFYHVTPEIQLQGVHGFNLDPWECRVALLVTGNQFPEHPTPPSQATVSLLGLRDGLARQLEGQGPLTPSTFESFYPIAPIRYHTVDIKHLKEEPGIYRNLQTEKLVLQSAMLEGGIWFIKYEQTPQERAHHVSVALAQGDRLDVYKPLVAEGAHLYAYSRYQLINETVTPVDDKTFHAAKAKVDALMGIH